MDTLASTGTDMLIQHGIPWLGKKAVEMGRYYGSEALRNPKLQKKALDYALEKATPFIKKTGSEILDQLSTKVRPNKKYVTDRKDLDGGAITYDDLLTDLMLTKMSPTLKKRKMNDLIKKGGSFDIHKAIGKLPKPKKGWTLPGHKYTGPYNDLEKQVRYNPSTGEMLDIYDQPTGRTDAIAMQHDVDYSVCKDDKVCKNKADKKMVEALDDVPYDERQWGHWLARNMINPKQKLGLGTPKNVKSRRVTGKKH